MRTAESWYNEYRGRRNDGALKAEQHVEFLRLVQEDAAASERQAMLVRLLGAARGGDAIPAWILVALQAPPAQRTATRSVAVLPRRA